MLIKLAAWAPLRAATAPPPGVDAPLLSALK
jgi:hypothetical protein